MTSKKTDEKNSHRYIQLEETNYRIHDSNRSYIDKKLLEEMDEFAQIEMYPKKRIVEISENDGVQGELNRLIKNLLEYREEEENGNSEAMCQGSIVDFLSKLDVLDFRTLKIENLLTVPAEKTPEEKLADKKRREELQIEYKKKFGDRFEKLPDGNYILKPKK